MDMHNIKRDPQENPYLTGKISLGQTVATTGTVLATAAPSALTSYSQTVVFTISQPATTLVTTRTDVIPITDSAQLSSYLASQPSTAQATSTAKSSSATAAPSNSTSASKGSSSNNLSTLIPAIVVPVAAILIISFVIFWFLMRRRHQRQLKEESQFVMASKPEKQISRGNSNSSGHSSTRELVPMSKLEKEMAVSTSEVKNSSQDIIPPKYSSTDIGLARPMTPPDKSNTAAKERSFPNFSNPRPGTANKSRLSQDTGNASRNQGNGSLGPRGMPPAQSAGKNGPPNPTRGPVTHPPRGPSSQQPKPSRPGDRNIRTDGSSLPKAGPPLITAMNSGTRAPPPKALNPPTPTGAFNGASPISQYSPIVKEHFNLDAVASSSTKSSGPAPLALATTNIPYIRDTDSPVDHSALSKENMRIARLANSSRLGFSSSPVEPNFPTRSASGTRALSPLAETQTKSGPTATSPRLPPPLSREDMPLKPFAQAMDSPAPGSSIYPSPSIGAGVTPLIGGNFSTTSLLQSDQRNHDAGLSENVYPRASIISRLSSDDGYVDMDVDAKSDVSSLDEREKWEMESDRQAISSRAGTGLNGSEYGSNTMSPIDGPAGASSAGTGTTKPSIRDRDSEGPFVLSRYQS